MTDEQTATNSSFWRGALVGFLFTVLGSILNGYLQHYFSIEEKNSQLFLDEKKDFVGACQEYLTQYRNWFSLMNYYTYQKTKDPAKLMEFDSVSVRPAYTKWRKDFDVAYGKMFLVSDNEFGINTMTVSDSLTKALSSIMEPGRLTTEQKEKVFFITNTYFLQDWLAKAQTEIFRYNTGKRLQKSIAEFQAERQKEAEHQADSTRVDDQMYKEWKKLIRPRLQQDSINGKRHTLPSREEFGEMMHPR